MTITIAPKAEPTDLDLLNDLSPMIRVTRNAMPDPRDERKTLFEFTVHDTGAGRVYVFRHNSSKAIARFIAAALLEAKELGVEILDIPAQLVAGMEWIETDGGLWLVSLIDPRLQKCLHYYLHKDPAEAAHGFWQSLDRSTLTAAQAQTPGTTPAKA